MSWQGVAAGFLRTGTPDRGWGGPAGLAASPQPERGRQGATTLPSQEPYYVFHPARTFC